MKPTEATSLLDPMPGSKRFAPASTGGSRGYLTRGNVVVASFIVFLIYLSFSYFGNSRGSKAGDGGGGSGGGLTTTNDLGAHMVGADRDEHGCIGSAGYQWCEKPNKCVRRWKS